MKYELNAGEFGTKWIQDQVNSGPSEFGTRSIGEFGTKWIRDQRLMISGPIFGEFGTNIIKHFLY